MIGLISFIIIVASVLLVLVVYVQNPKGGGLNSEFGSAVQLGGAKRATDILEKGAKAPAAKKEAAKPAAKATTAKPAAKAAPKKAAASDAPAKNAAAPKAAAAKKAEALRRISLACRSSLTSR